MNHMVMLSLLLLFTLFFFVVYGNSVFAKNLRIFGYMTVKTIFDKIKRSRE